MFDGSRLPASCALRRAATPHHGRLWLAVLGAACTGASAQADTCPPHPATDVEFGVSADAWHTVSQRDTTCVYARYGSGSGVREVLAVATIAATPDRVAAVISDFARYPDFMPYVAATKVLDERGPTSWVFQQLAFPFPISARYYTIRLDADRRPGGGHRIAWTLAGDGEPRATGSGEATRVNDGLWDLQPADGGATRVTYAIHTDPGGMLPAFVVNQANSVAVPLVIERVRERVLTASTEGARR